MPSAHAKRSAWSRALELAGRTPESRNRYVDFLRAVSIGAVISGHWLIAAPWMKDGTLRLDHMLGLAPWTQWLTWLFQVMPVFFMVGGYSNAASWEAALRERRPYNEWLASRLDRLIGPMIPLVVVWAVSSIVAYQAGVPEEMIRIGSQVALVPTWFLAVYIGVAMLVPLTFAAWRRFGMGSIVALALAAVVVDVLAFVFGIAAPRWANYLFVWLSVHQLGYAWRSGSLRPIRAGLLGIAGAVLLLSLVTVFGYPLSMVGVPGASVSNTLPPTLAMLALGWAQAGIVLTFERPARRWLSRPAPWALTILVNGMIMSIYLWHSTVMIWIIGGARLLGGFGLHLLPGDAIWWATRPLWMLVLAAAMIPVLGLVARFERPAPREGSAPAAWRLVAGALLVCASLALLALGGIGTDHQPGIRVTLVVALLAGAALAGATPRLSRRRVEGSG
jgi:hypothetical protein